MAHLARSSMGMDSSAVAMWTWLGQIHAVWNVGQAIAIGDDDAAVGGDAGDPEETEVDDADVERGADAASELKRVVAAGLAAQRSGGGGGRDGVALGPCR